MSVAFVILLALSVVITGLLMFAIGWLALPLGVGLIIASAAASE